MAKPFVDGAADIDLYAPRVELAEPIQLGNLALTAGDQKLVFTLTGANTLIVNSLAFFDAKGEGTARFVLPKGHTPTLAGTLLHHAYIVMDLTKLSIDDASNARPLMLVK